jgi:uncharacterized protein YdhG (YjbR/CyaY superfamily)
MTVIDKYLADIEPKSRAELERIRTIANQTTPGLKEVISYGIPALYYRSHYLIGFAAFKKHLSLFPGSGPITAFKNELINYKTSKGTIQFTTDNPLPKELIVKIVKFNVAKISEKLNK